MNNTALEIVEDNVFVCEFYVELSNNYFGSLIPT